MKISQRENGNQNETGSDETASNSSANLSSVQIPSITLPTGGGAIKGIQEQFQVSSVTGTSSFSVPIPFSPARLGFTPSATLTYSSGAGNSAFGLGWDVSIPSVTRSTRRRLPEYKDEIDSDIFTLDGAEDLVPKLELKTGKWVKVINEKSYAGVDYTVFAYRPRIESAHARIERWISKLDGQVHWQTINGDNVRSVYGLTSDCRVSDPSDNTRIFKWLLCYSHDDKGNIVSYQYKQEDFVGVPATQYEKNRIGNCTQTYIKKIQYGNKTPYFLDDPLPATDGFLFEAVFDYGEHDETLPVPKTVNIESQPWDYRLDAFSSYRSGFEIRTYRRCQRILMFHCFEPEDLPHSPYLTKSLNLNFSTKLDLAGAGDVQAGFSFLIATKHNGHKWDSIANHYTSKSLPELEITYQQHDWNTDVVTLSSSDDENSAFGMGDQTHLWLDLFSEGITGVLTEREHAWYYKSNLGGGAFSRAEPLIEKPSLMGLSTEALAIQDLSGDGLKSLVHYDEPRGSFALQADQKWSKFKSFEFTPNVSFGSALSRFIDLDGDGILDLVLTEESRIKWFPSLGDKGFKLPQSVSKAIDEDKEPSILFEDRDFSLFLADMTGDGLTDIVRIMNGSVSYWPNLGFGHFGRQVSMSSAPAFDHPDTFNPNYLRLADIDGSGTTDIIYLGQNEIHIWLNDSGNAWSSQPQKITAFNGVSDYSNISVLDFLGSGTACLVYRSDLEKHADAPVKYIDLMGSKKPGLMSGYITNTGLETHIQYKSSTHYYLEDKKAGKNWITTLPFPVHCVDSIKVEDKVRETVFTTFYRYRHGYFDRVEKEYRGFARVETVDTEEFAQFKLNNTQNVVEEVLHQAPVKTVSWFHTGAYLQGPQILHQCANEYFSNNDFTEYSMQEHLFPDDLSLDELVDAHRALKGELLRTETYSDDGAPNSGFPYITTSYSVSARKVQPQINDYIKPSFQVVPQEKITYGYDRNPSDPRISQSYVLEVDQLGNPTVSVSVSYPRVDRPTGSEAIPDGVWNEQNKLSISLNEAVFTDDIQSDSTYRLRVGVEARSYDVSGISQPSEFYISFDELKTSITIATEISFEEEFTSGVQKRLLTHSRSYFLKDDLSGPLPLGELSTLALPDRSYDLAFTEHLATELFADKVTAAMMVDAKYQHTEGDSSWWVASEKAIYTTSPGNSFFQPVGVTDLAGNTSKIEFDKYSLLPVKSIDAFGLSSTAVLDYGNLAPTEITDVNLNRAAVEVDELGYVVRSAVMGKAGTSEGDSLANPTTLIEYDLNNWQSTGKPNSAHYLAKKQHGSSNAEFHESFQYFDGMGRVVMTKTRAKAGKAKRWDEATNQIVEAIANPRWLGSGKSIVNNKGNTVKSYQPFFSTTHEYEAEQQLVEIGSTAIHFYDPVNRNIRTELPNGTFVESEFSSWYLIAKDLNDTVKDSEWYIDRNSPDPLLDPEPADPEERAAWLTAKHHDTPATTHFDSLGRPFYSVTDHGNAITSHVRSETDMGGRFSRIYDQLGRLIVDGRVNMLGQPAIATSAEKGDQWKFFDALGRVIRTWDNDSRHYRTEYDALHRPVSTFVTEGAANEVLFGYVLYGETLPTAIAQQRNLNGQPVLTFDQAGVVRLKLIDFKGNSLVVEKQLLKNYEAIADWTVLLGLTDESLVETNASALLEAEVFSSSTEMDALNRPTLTTLADGTVIKPTYDEGNTLASIEAKIGGQGSFINFLQKQDYDAKGQRQFAEYGNGLITRYFYDSETFNLISLLTKPATSTDSSALQHLQYTYDPVGNIVECDDRAQQTHFFNNAVVSANRKYEYDPIYQLIKASGREHAGISSATQTSNTDLSPLNQLPHLNQSNAVRRYTENYEYDHLGNILKLSHLSNTASWTRHYRYAYQADASDRTNRLSESSLPGDSVSGSFGAKYDYDAHGNMTRMPHLQSMEWNFHDQLTRIDLGGGGMAFYVFGLGGIRTRKVIQRQGGKRVERIYLGAVEIYREYLNNVLKFERRTVHISDNEGRIAQIDTKTLDLDNADPNNPLDKNLIRYQFVDHLKSATLETNDIGKLISYEEYHPFGTTAYRNGDSNENLSLKRYRFSGKERDEESDLYYFGARFYAPWLGRWTSTDTAGMTAGSNMFRYCANNPVVYHDPTGQQEETVIESTVKLLTAAPASAYDRNRKQDYLDFVRTEREYVYSATSSLGNELRIRSRDQFRVNDAVWQDSRWHASGVTLLSRQVISVTRSDGTLPTSTTPQEQTTSASQDANTETPNQTRSGNQQQAQPQERTFWSRGGSALLMGGVLLAAGLFTVFTAGAGTPALVLAMGYMAAGGGALMVGGSSTLMTASYSGHTSAETDREVTQALHDVGSLSSPFGLAGGAVGYAVDGREGMRTGATIGNVIHLGHGLARFGVARLASGSTNAITTGDAAVNNAVSTMNTAGGAGRGTSVLVSHGNASGQVMSSSGVMAPLADILPVIESSPHGNVVVLACKIGQNPQAVQSLANSSGRAVTAYQGLVSSGTNSLVNVTSSAGVPAAAVTRVPQYLSPYLNLSPNVATPAANITSGATR